MALERKVGEGECLICTWGVILGNLEVSGRWSIWFCRVCEEAGGVRARDLRLLCRGATAGEVE